MIDTVRLESPPVSERLARAIEGQLRRRLEIDNASGEVLWELTRGELAGSFDHRISVQVKREQWHVPAANSLYRITERIERKERRAAPILVPCEPYLIIEGSVHKAIMGHNIYGGPLEPVPACRWFVQELAARLGEELPVADDCFMERIDVAEVFQLGSFEGCQEFIEGASRAKYPRRKVKPEPGEGFWAAGDMTMVKVYHKGVEFAKRGRDRSRLERGKHFTADRIEWLQERANGIIRVETEIKARKLAAMFGQKPTVVQVTREAIERVHDCEVSRLLREGAYGMQVVRTRQEVSRRLHATYTQEQARGLLGTWIQMAVAGESEVRRSMPIRTFYDHRKKLQDAGCAWLSTDVVEMKHSAIPKGFSPVRADRRHMAGESREVRAALAPFSFAVPALVVA